MKRLWIAALTIVLTPSFAAAQGLIAQIASLNHQVDALNTHVDGLKGQVDALNTHVSGLDARVGDVDNQLDALKQIAADLRCAAARSERADFMRLTGRDVAWPVDAENVPAQWEPIPVAGVPTAEIRGRPAIVDISYQRPYRFIRFQVGANHRMDYATNNPIWDNNGWNAALHMLRLDDQWAIFTDENAAPLWLHTPSGWRGRYKTLPRTALSPLAVAQNECLEGSSGNQPQPLCLTEFIVQLPPATRLTGVSDVESVRNYAVSNDAFVYDFKLWGLAAPAPPEACR